MSLDSESQSPRRSEFVRLLMSNQKSIYGYILSMVHNCPDADDLMQETAILMWERFDDFEEGTNFGAWGIKIARFKVLNFYKTTKKAERFDESLLEDISNCYQNKSSEVKDRLQALQKCLGKLSEGDRKLMAIRYEQDIKVTQLAEVVGRPVQGLYKAMARIHGMLQRCVNRTINNWETQR